MLGGGAVWARIFAQNWKITVKWIWSLYMIFTKLNFRNSHQISNWYLHKQKSFSTKVPPQNHQNWILRYQEDYLCSQSNIFRLLCHFFQSILVQLAIILLKNDVLAALALLECDSLRKWIWKCWKSLIFH